MTATNTGTVWDRVPLVTAAEARDHDRREKLSGRKPYGKANH